ncbi:acetyltransferase [Brevibacillus laterosporus]|uniref:O-acetyltransferase OatA n=1 Tax=Brevibacillus laterosporus LMG 15441 TaxID=1042163 RepID=A0A075R2E9_BRELA|nr:acyltransferase family protein [Brevibacillus laterosporus]AIG26034.1 O-acetyltransferase OatA [Brevibacillus laterosporus LMG 15441]RJL13046.1 acetyltransferase [Brevibacillus laterosporus]TPH08042.1 acetyltransferase [Brevibacillus laterosporus]
MEATYRLNKSHVNIEDGKRRYMPGLDGIRALAVLVVVAYHFGWRGASGGLLGVNVFFVLSGYLIMDLLVEEYRSKGRIDLKRFWFRRARRLLPALLLMLLVVSVILFISDSSRFVSIRGDIWAAIMYMSNWYFIYHDVSYFESFGPASPFGHLWSLAVEEQFYLLLPLLLFGIIRFTNPTCGKLALYLLIGAAVSFGTMVLLYDPNTDPSRVYYGTDTRAFGFLIGAALALAWPSRILATPLSRKGTVVLDVVGAIGGAIVAYMIVFTGEYDEWLYRGGMVVLSVAAALVIAAAVSPFTTVSKLLAWKPLRWVGQRSYGIYLLHYPIIVLTAPANPNMKAGLLLQLVLLVVMIWLAALSYKFVESPFVESSTLIEGWKRSKIELRKRVNQTAFIRRRRLSVLLSIGMIVLLCVSCAQRESETTGASSKEVKQEMIQGETTDKLKEEPKEEPELHELLIQSQDVQTPSLLSDGVTAIGDSVLLGVAPELEKLVPGIMIDAKVSRQMKDALAIVQQLESENRLGKCVIVELGTNGPFTSDTLTNLLDTLGAERQIILINTRVPRNWQDKVNQELSRAGEERSNVKIIDWYSYSANQSGWLTKDGIHLQPEGAKAYASLVAETISN